MHDTMLIFRLWICGCDPLLIPLGPSAQMINLSCGHSFRIHGNYFLVDIGDIFLLFFDHLRFKCELKVLRNLNVHAAAIDAPSFITVTVIIRIWTFWFSINRCSSISVSIIFWAFLQVGFWDHPECPQRTGCHTPEGAVEWYSFFHLSCPFPL